jgi:hypothetical protein
MLAGDTGRRLIPDDIADEVRHVDIVDRSPYAAVLYGVHLDGDNRPDFIREGTNGIHDRKIAEARLNLAEAGNDGGTILAACNSFVLVTLVAGNSNRSSVLRWRDLWSAKIHKLS